MRGNVLLHSVVLIIHVTAVFVLCSALSIEALSLVHLRRAFTLDESHLRQPDESRRY